MWQGSTCSHGKHVPVPDEIKFVNFHMIVTFTSLAQGSMKVAMKVHRQA